MSPRTALLTERDREILGWLSRQRIATADDLATRFGIARSAAYARLRALAAHGLVDHVRIFRAEPGVYWATSAGLSLGGQPGRATKISLASYHHDLALTALCADLEREFGAERVLTERELRAAEADSERPRYAATLGGGGRGWRPRRHYPDLVVERYRDARPLAVELECTRKAPARLDSILRAYVRARHIGAVRYYASTPAVSRALRSAISRVKPPHGFVELSERPLLPSSPAAAVVLSVARP